MIKYYCDRCGKDITAETRYKLIAFDDNKVFNYDIRLVDKMVCHECYEHLNEWMDFYKHV